mmetsp:Transcript_163944/g.525791  ORF Transcript_163944/g.525791 Transcript_163944/m.525791 type:complete len:297 (+) Transcript_163944:571-1461(+)
MARISGSTWVWISLKSANWTSCRLMLLRRCRSAGTLRRCSLPTAVATSSGCRPSPTRTTSLRRHFWSDAMAAARIRSGTSAGSPRSPRKAGVLRCSSQGPWIQMDFPAQMATSEGLGRAEEFAKALGLKTADVLAIARGPVTTPDWLVEVSSASFAAIEPDLGAIARVRPLDRGLIVTCAGAGFDLTAEGPPAAKRPRILTCGGSSAKHSAAGSFDFLSRFFAPTVGVPEDPVTGSAHCILTPYWTKKLQRPDGAPLQALQASPRGGLLEVAFHAKEQRVDIRGQAVTVLTGRMEV